MLLLGIGIGCVVGFLTACCGFYNLKVGTLKVAYDELDSETYLYIEFDKPYIPKRKYIVLRDGRSRR